jgi:hypothetical protein
MRVCVGFVIGWLFFFYSFFPASSLSPSPSSFNSNIQPDLIFFFFFFLFPLSSFPFLHLLFFSFVSSLSLSGFFSIVAC